MNISVITLFPAMFQALTNFSIIKRADDKKLLNLKFINPRDYASPPHYAVDDKPYGGGPGMLMSIAPIQRAIHECKTKYHSENTPVIYLSPQGTLLTQPKVKELMEHQDLILLCGHYEGIDERLIDLEVDMELSIGNYIVTGGELPAMIVIDSITRLIPGALGSPKSAQEDSFSDNHQLKHPQYTKPQIYQGKKVPEALLSGNHEKIKAWKKEHKISNTMNKRPDLLMLKSHQHKAKI